MDEQGTVAGAYKGNTRDMMLSPIKQVKGLLQEGMKKFTNTQEIFKVGHQGRIKEGSIQLAGLTLVEEAPEGLNQPTLQEHQMRSCGKLGVTQTFCSG